MLTLLSPAKKLDQTRTGPPGKVTPPRLLAHTGELIDVLQQQTPDQLQQLMHLSADLAALNTRRHLELAVPPTTANASPAAWLYDGDTYTGLDATTLAGDTLDRAQQQLRILSGLYGLLRPLDLIQPHRLEMGTRLVTDRGRRLYDFWGSTVAELLADDLDTTPGVRAVVNLASSEYFTVIGTQLAAPVITPRFVDQTKAGSWKVVSVHAKRARGTMARWIVDHAIDDPAQLPDFDVNGYRYDPAESTDAGPVFRRPRS